VIPDRTTPRTADCISHRLACLLMLLWALPGPMHSTLYIYMYSIVFHTITPPQVQGCSNSETLSLQTTIALYLLSMLVFMCNPTHPATVRPALVDFHRQVTHGPPPSFHIAWKKPRRCQPLCTPPNQDARLKWRLWLDFRCPASHFSCLRCSFLMFIFDEEIHSNSYLLTRKYHLNG